MFSSVRLTQTTDRLIQRTSTMPLKMRENNILTDNCYFIEEKQLTLKLMPSQSLLSTTKCRVIYDEEYQPLYSLTEVSCPWVFSYGVFTRPDFPMQK